MEDKIKKIIKKEDIDIRDYLELEKLYSLLKHEGLTDFYVNGREDSTRSDFWFQVEYYNKKLNSTIIVDYDYDMSPDKVSDIVKQIEYINKKIKKIKSRIIKK